MPVQWSCSKERMREFMVEGKRWYDLRLAGDEYMYWNILQQKQPVCFGLLIRNTLTNNSALKPDTRI